MSGSRLETWIFYFALNIAVVAFVFFVNHVGSLKDEHGFSLFLTTTLLIFCSGEAYRTIWRLSPHSRPLTSRFWTLPESSWLNCVSFAFTAIFTRYLGLFLVIWSAVLIPGAYAQAAGVSWTVVATVQSAFYLFVMTSITNREHRRGLRTIRDAVEDSQRRENQRRQLELQARISQHEQAIVSAGAQRRREDARAECDALFALAAPEIGSRFSKQDLTEFESKYMSDTTPPEVVEERGEQLKGIIRHHWERIEPPRQNFKELSVWFEQRMSEIQSVPDEKIRKGLIVQLKSRYAELTSTMLSEMSP